MVKCTTVAAEKIGLNPVDFKKCLFLQLYEIFCSPTTICWSFHLPVCLCARHTCLPACLSVGLLFCLPVYLQVLPAGMPVGLPISLPVCLPVCAPIFLPVCLSYYLPAC
jgi:hypothetical protein